MQLGIDFGDTVGFDDLPGECHVLAVSENGKINVNDPLFLDGERARNNVATQLFSLTGGQLPESPYDALFTTEDETGTLTTRIDLITAVIDWWDPRHSAHGFRSWRGRDPDGRHRYGGRLALSTARRPVPKQERPLRLDPGAALGAWLYG